MFDIKQKAISCSYNHPFTVQNGSTALKQASFVGYHKVVELLLGAGANPDIQNKVKTVMYILKYFMHPCIYVILFQHLLYFTITGTYSVPRPFPTALHVLIMGTATNL